MNPIEMLRTLVENIAEGERVKKFGFGYREKAQGQALENQKTQMEIADLPETMKQRHSTAQIALDAEEERKAQDIADALAHGGDTSPTGRAALHAKRESEERDLKTAKTNAEIAREQAATEAAKKNDPNFRPDISPESAKYLGVSQSSDAGPMPLPTNTDIGILGKRREEEARIEAARLSAQSRVDAAGKRGAQPKLTKIQDPEHPGRTIAVWVTPGQDPVKIGDAPMNATSASRADAAEAVSAQEEDIKTALRDPATAKTLGPILGRYNNLREFIGNPPPEYAKLAGEIHSFALANMGIHGMRSTEGAKWIATLMDGKHTPESLIATLDGLTNYAHKFLGVTRPGSFGSDVIPGGVGATTGGAPGATTVEEYVRDPLTKKLVLKRTQ